MKQHLKQIRKHNKRDELLSIVIMLNRENDLVMRRLLNWSVNFFYAVEVLDNERK